MVLYRVTLIVHLAGPRWLGATRIGPRRCRVVEFRQAVHDRLKYSRDSFQVPFHVRTKQEVGE